MIQSLWTLPILFLMIFGGAATRSQPRLRSAAKFSPCHRLQMVRHSLLLANGAVALGALLLIALFLVGTPATALAAEPTQEIASPDQNLAIGAALATGLAAIGAGIAVGIAGAAAIGAITEKPEVLGRALIFVGLAEGIAIYGLIVSFMILTR